ncbi:unnamed protein product [Closterium sp. NIES-54]
MPPLLFFLPLCILIGQPCGQHRPAVCHRTVVRAGSADHITNLPWLLFFLFPRASPTVHLPAKWTAQACIAAGVCIPLPAAPRIPHLSHPSTFPPLPPSIRPFLFAETPTAADVCASFQFNPCGGGACVSLPNGTYTCQCPLGTTIGNNGTIAPTCVPCPTCLNSPNPPSTSPPSASPPSTSPPPTSPPPTIPPPTSLPSTSPPPTSPAPASAPPPIASSGTPSGEQAGGNASGTQEPQAPSQARSGKGLGVEGSIISSCAIVLLLQTLMLM